MLLRPGRFKAIARSFPLIACGALLAICSHGVAAERLPLKAYTTADGLPTI